MEFAVVYVPTCSCASVVYVLLILRANVPYGVPMFQLDVPKVPILKHFLLRNSKRNFYTLLYKKCYIIRDIIVIHIMCICIAHKNCIIFHVWIFFFFICSLVRNENIRFSRVSSNFPQLKQLIKIKNTCEYYDLFELWCA